MEIPEAIRNLPIDERRGLPIPFMNQNPKGGHSFVSIFAPQVIRALQENLCSICGQPLSFASAFVGGPLSASSRVYSDPPFHPACAEFAMTVCPHIIISHAKRATPERIQREVIEAKTHESATLVKPQEWVIGIAPTRETQWELLHDGIYIYPGKLTKRIVYKYDDNGTLVRSK